MVLTPNLSVSSTTSVKRQQQQQLNVWLLLLTLFFFSEVCELLLPFIAKCKAQNSQNYLENVKTYQTYEKAQVTEHLLPQYSMK